MMQVVTNTQKDILILQKQMSTEKVIQNYKKGDGLLTNQHYKDHLHCL